MLECRFVLPLALLLTISLLSAEAIQRCGVRNVKRVNLILGGRNAMAGKWPWHATLMHRTGDAKKLACGGNIIDKHTILTAAHCLYDRHKLIALDRLVVILGRTELSVEKPWSRSYAPERLILHPGYKQANVKDDIAIVKLASEITMSDYIFPVCLWPRGPTHEAITGRKGFVVGYGLNDAGSTSSHLLDAEVPVIDRWTCLESNRDTLSSQLASTMLCAGARDGVGPCNGDSGGGMFFTAGSVWYIRGVVSFAPNLDSTGKCDPKQYAIYTDVAKYLDWITNELDNVTQSDTSESMANSTNFLEGQTQLTVNREGCGLEPPVYRALTSAHVFAAPWVTKIEYVGEERASRGNECQAYLITEWHLLTLASCVADVDQNEQEIYVRLGKFNVPGLPKPQIRFVEQIIIHERYDKSNYANDVALLKLRKKANGDEGFVNSICLAPTKENEWHSYWLEGRVKNTTRIGSTVIFLQDSNTCRLVYAEEGIYLPADDSFVCYAYEHFSVSRITVPVTVKTYWNGKQYLMGLLSRLLPIPKEIPDSRYQYIAFVNVSFYRSWIDDHILN
ncbi:prostasin-like [Anopheles arabiensis]|uniref:Peptidase S1 domain-containing protein n=1 Tax=Anopheles arabiensis TaxID=7173 RepID=A0A2C9GRM5_ANOAR|nr:prostasin-like [Anopheles arabiensis]